MESKRIKKFKESLIKEIPFFPNNRETKEALLSQAKLPIILHYLNWKSRYIPLRARKVSLESYVLNDQRFLDLKGKMDKLFIEVTTGTDLTPYLSLKAHKKGYTPNTQNDKWADKDFLLNVMGFHHLHLEEFPARTNEVVFVKVTREEFRVIAIFDHSVFKSKSDDVSLNKERSRLWSIFEEYSSRGVPPNSVYLPSVITTSGHPLHMVDMASSYNEIIHNIDPNLENKKFIAEIYSEASLEIPKNNRLTWQLYDLDLGLIDKANNFFIFKYGPC